jgi:hypothetical protein
MLISSFLFFYSSLFQRGASREQVLLASVLFVVLHIANIRVLFEGLYWMSAAICYQLAICLFVLGIGSLIRYLRTPSLPWAATAILCCLLLPGTAESIAPIFVFVLACILFISIRRGRRSYFTFACIAVSLSSLAIISLSKGNLTRVHSSTSSHNQDILQALFYSTRAVGYYVVYWLTTPMNIAALIIALPTLNKLANRSELKWLSFRFNPLLLVPLFYFLCVVIYLPLTYFESSVAYPRITTLVFFIAAHLSVVFFWTLLQNFLQFSRFVTYYSSLKNFNTYAWILFFITAFGTLNYYKVANDLASGSAYTFNEEANKRYFLITSCKDDTCYVPKFSRWPFFIQSSKKENLSFVYMSKYFGKTIVYKNE